MRFNFNNLNPIFKPYLTRRTLRSPLALQPLNSHYNYDTPFYIPKRWHLGHSDHHHDAGEQGEKIFRLGLAADIGLAAGKAFTGYVSGSTAIIADAAHSVSDVVLSGVALLSFKAGNAPKDKEHPYGHGKFETLGALGISSMLLITAGGIGWHAIDILLGLLSGASEVGSHSLMHDHGHSPDHHGIDMSHPGLALTMTVVSISVKEGLYWITKRAGEKQGSGLMKANAWHHRADAISSIVALIGVGGSILGVRFLDPLAGLVVSGMILKAGLETGYQSIMELVDAAIPGEHLDPVRKTILHVEGVKGCHCLRGRRAGSYLFLDVHIEVDPFLSVSAAHGIGENVRQAIHRFHPEIAEAFIHIDPSISDFSPSMMDQHEKLEGISSQNNNNSLEDKEIEGIVSNVFLTKLLKKVKVEHVTRHLLQGKTLLEIEVSMPPDILIREAMEAAEAAEEEILNAASDIVQVSLQLRLGKPIPKQSIEQREC